MAIKSSGQLSFSEIAAEFGGSAPFKMSDYYKGGSRVTDYGSNPVPASGEIEFEDFFDSKKNPCAAGFTVDFSNSRCQRTVVSSYQWTDLGFRPDSSRRTGNRNTTFQDSTWNDGSRTHPTITCGSGTVGSQVGDGTNRGGTYSDIAHAWPRYRIQGLKAQVGRPNPTGGQGFRSGGSVRFYRCDANESTETINFSSL